MSYEQQIKEALARGYCTPENSSKELDSTLIEAMTQEILKSVGFIPSDDSRQLKQQVSREVGGQPEPNFVKEIERVINSFSKENDSNTPDFILAEYLNNCLNNFTTTSRAREKWYGTELHI